ncbi:hypothetical protein [Bythopirellula goksoeyrii]|uniref:Carboxypeptidase regulatory-like domain-containing protein n=1 Tax=Bythopirellula goksoeyrii TaxID=1400387 RepID=A0A5B9Q8R1_9BACT|nr:hypothetical protein [Bythopirellula goksoeyrii]QEG33935.1 hypothetical protein Pr1d_12060 [Bythopirellula goksoeyrii]
MKTDHRFWPLMPLTLLLICTIGCDDSPIREISGTVTLDGKPLETGEILFKPLSGSTGPTAGSEIENGSYQIPAVTQGLRVGNEYQVEITSMVGSGRMSPDPNDPTGQRELLENVIPERYNTSTTLQVTISSDRAANNIDFELESKPSP